MIEVENLNYYYGNFHCLQNINFQVKKGQIAGFIGPNGAGKSTTLKILCGYLVPSSGKTLFDNISLADEPFKAREKIGYVPETPVLYPELKLVEYLYYVGRLKGIKKAILKTKIPELIDRCHINQYTTTLVGSLSKGNKQRLALAQALLADPSILLLDEPMASLDPAEAIYIRSLIHQLKNVSTILLCSHNLSDVSQICDQLICIKEGKVHYQGSIHTIDNLYDNSLFTLRFSRLEKADLQSFQNMAAMDIEETDFTARCLQVRVNNADNFFKELYSIVDKKELQLREIVSSSNVLESFFRQD
jgi:ABC-2 type transport system ATP-binding protein